MRKVQLFIGDDLLYAETRDLIQADETLYLALGTDPERLKVTELDLITANADALRKFLQPYLDAGHAPGEMMTQPGDGSTGREHRGQDPENRRYFAGMRDWSDRHGFTTTDGRPGYHKLVKGGFYYSPQLRRAYPEFLAGLAGSGQEPPS